MKKKFLDYDDPYFDPGSVWIRNDETQRPTLIVNLKEFGDGPHDFAVYHRPEYPEDIGSVEVCTSMKYFQIRYIPVKYRGEK